jgi:antitoxin (DNA-binding transcriptional repressor) of toxin-antitoxin stability system
MRRMTIPEMRAALSRVEDLLREEGELVLTRRGEPIARVIPIQPAPKRLPSRADLRASMKKMEMPSEVLIRADRDSR